MVKHYERIDSSKEFDAVRPAHEIRYHIAAGFIGDEDVVIDAGCGEAYGRPILMHFEKGHNGYAPNYIGIDRNPPKGVPGVHEYDFEIAGKENRVFTIADGHDVFVGFECIEHLDADGVQNYVDIAHNSRKWIIVSTPIVPNSNPFHKQQFTEQQMVDLFVNDDFEHFGTLKQGDIYGIFIFKRHAA